MTTTVANIVVTAALEEMAKVSGAAIGDIVATIAADPSGAAARRFRELLAIALKVASEVEAVR
jgi:hypothetical protein